MINANISSLRRSPYKRDVYLAYLIDGARHTAIDGFPIIEPWMVADTAPKELTQWDQRRSVLIPSETGMSFYCEDSTFTGVLNNPKKYVESLRKYQCVIGIDASPYDNMPLVVQNSQIYVNLAITYYFGRKGIKVIPNVRLGDMRTLSSLAAYPKHCLIAIGTHGFVKALDNRNIFSEEVRKIIEFLEPTGIIVYGSAPDWLFEPIVVNGVPIYQYDSFIERRKQR